MHNHSSSAYLLQMQHMSTENQLESLTDVQVGTQRRLSLTVDQDYVLRVKRAALSAGELTIQAVLQQAVDAWLAERGA